METIFKYNGNPITFNSDGEVWINATEMSRPFKNKPVKYFLDDPSRYRITIKLCNRNSLNINEVDISTSLSISQLAQKYPESVKVVKGANNQQGTWFQEDIALEFARWLSPDFAIWCNDHIKELLKIGMTALPQTLEDMINNPDLVIGLAQKVKELRAVNEQNKRMITALFPKARFAENVLEASGSITINELAKVLKVRNKKGKIIGQNTLFKMLQKDDFLDSHKRPYQKWVTAGMFTMRPVRGSDGKLRTQVMVTAKGVERLDQFYKPKEYQQQLILAE